MSEVTCPLGEFKVSVVAGEVRCGAPPSSIWGRADELSSFPAQGQCGVRMVV